MSGLFGQVFLLVLAAGLAVLVVRGVRTDRGARTAPARLPFLGGHPPEVHAWSRFHVRYAPMALLFLAFDMEMVFMYPWARVFVEEGAVALIEMLMFIAVLVLGILYAWRERALEWS